MNATGDSFTKKNGNGGLVEEGDNVVYSEEFVTFETPKVEEDEEQSLANHANRIVCNGTGTVEDSNNRLWSSYDEPRNGLSDEKEVVTGKTDKGVLDVTNNKEFELNDKASAWKTEGLEDEEESNELLQCTDGIKTESILDLFYKQQVIEMQGRHADELADKDAIIAEVEVEGLAVSLELQDTKEELADLKRKEAERRNTMTKYEIVVRWRKRTRRELLDAMSQDDRTTYDSYMFDDMAKAILDEPSIIDWEKCKVPKQSLAELKDQYSSVSRARLPKGHPIEAFKDDAEFTQAFHNTVQGFASDSARTYLRSMEGAVKSDIDEELKKRARPQVVRPCPIPSPATTATTTLAILNGELPTSRGRSNTRTPPRSGHRQGRSPVPTSRGRTPNSTSSPAVPAQAGNSSSNTPPASSGKRGRSYSPYRKNKRGGRNKKKHRRPSE